MARDILFPANVPNKNQRIWTGQMKNVSEESPTSTLIIEIGTSP
jgi:hypothetical protein